MILTYNNFFYLYYIFSIESNIFILILNWLFYILLNAILQKNLLTNINIFILVKILLTNLISLIKYILKWGNCFLTI